MMSEFDNLELSRKNCIKFVIFGAVFIAAGVLLFMSLQEIPALGIIFALGGFIVLVTGFIKFSNLARNFKNKYLPELINEILPGSKYDAKGGLSKDAVYGSGFLKKADRFTTGDLIVGKIGDVDFSTCDLKLEERHTRHTKNGTQTYYIAYFTGRFFEFDFNKNFKGKVITTEGSITTWGKGLSKIELESIDYNKKFKTYTNEEHSAFYILTPHFMESIMELERRNPGTISLSFNGNRLNIGINNSKDTFELSLFKKIDQGLVNGFKNDLLVIKGIVEELKLNRNIFM